MREVPHAIERLDVEALRCLCAVSTLAAKTAGRPESLLEAALPLIARGFERPETVRARVVFAGLAFSQPGFKDTDMRLAADLPSGCGTLTVCRVDGGGAPFLDEERLLLGLVAEQLADALSRLQTQRALQASEARYRTFIETTQDAFLECGPDLRLTFVNKRACEMFGYGAGEMLGLHIVEDCQFPEDKAELRSRLKDRLSGNRDSFEHRYRKKDGTALWAWVSGNPLLDANGAVTGAFAMMTDITARKQAEANLIALQKLESLCILAGGIAHDFNNILTGILGNLSMLAARPDLEAGAKELLESAQQACRTGKALSGQLLTFSKGGAPRFTVFDLRETVRKTADFSARGSGVRVVCDIGPAPLAVKADKDQLAQVVQNLVLNAVQAMPQGGEVTVRAASAEVSPGEVPPLPAGRYALVTVRDQGGGIPAENLSRVFDPYFTTKEKGHGLGLSVCHSIMLRHSGAVTVSSTPGQGSVFTLYFPATDCAEPAGEPEARPVKGDGRRVLVMDDEYMVAMTLSVMLKHLGYAADSVSNGGAALEAYGKALRAGAPYAAVFLDVTVAGGLGAREVLPRLAALDPAVKAVVSSGYSNDEAFAGWKEHGFAAALGKPYDLAEVSAALRQALGPG